MGQDYSLSCSQEPVRCAYPEKDEYNPHHAIQTPTNELIYY